MRFYLTTAIDYVNSRPHLGTAYEKITADVIARYKRLAGATTHFLMGNDEHSQNVLQARTRAGLGSAGVLRPDGGVFRERLERGSTSRSTTSSARPSRATRPPCRSWRSVSTTPATSTKACYEGWYCVSCEAFKPEKDLVDGMCPIHPTQAGLDPREELLLPAVGVSRPLLEHFDGASRLHPAGDPPQRDPAARSKPGSRTSRSAAPARPGASRCRSIPSSVVYVWFDALINYARRSATAPTTSGSASGGRPTCTSIGKDITRFHCVVWPAMLMSAGLAAAAQVFGHGWVTSSGQQDEQVARAPSSIRSKRRERLGADPLRLYLVKEIPYGGDGDFSWERFEERYNADLANNLGNLVSRVDDDGARGTAAAGWRRRRRAARLRGVAAAAR